MILNKKEENKHNQDLHTGDKCFIFPDAYNKGKVKPPRAANLAIILFLGENL